ncbi:Lar family restriction alleviation protein [Acetanaerobacterium sp. MSJ-12]|uniref:Lar family restriction alleviation protein n=1 Tax=Acetanaerobacterium sp. MSJ-12 TaxID=2841535 RepID=UPI00336BDE5C
MTDLVRRALLGDQEAQEKCTRQGIVLPCPCCGGEAKLKQLSGRWSVCCLNNCVGSRIYNDNQRALATWNTRQAPLIGRCETCGRREAEYAAETICGELLYDCELMCEPVSLSGFCSGWIPREEEDYETD